MTNTEIIAVVQAAERGEKIQNKTRDLDGQWCDCLEAPAWNFVTRDYRVKPKPREMFANKYSIQNCSGPILTFHRSKEEADRLAGANRIAVLRFVQDTDWTP